MVVYAEKNIIYNKMWGMSNNNWAVVIMKNCAKSLIKIYIKKIWCMGAKCKNKERRGKRSLVWVWVVVYYCGS